MMNWDSYTTLLDMEQTERAEKGLPPLFNENQEELLMKKKKKTYTLDQKTVDLVRHILTARIDNSTRMSQRMAYHCARDVFEYALAGNIEALTQFDYMETKEEM